LAVRLRDLLGLALSALWQQKVRTLLTTLGVMFGSFVLVASFSVRRGVDEAIVRQYTRFGELRRIEVNPSFSTHDADVPPEELKVPGNMSDERRQRLRQEITRHWVQEHAPNRRVRLTPALLRDLAALDHVTAVRPNIYLYGTRVFLDGKAEHALAQTAPLDGEELKKRMLAGTYFASDSGREVLLSEYLLYRLGVVDEQDVARVIGRQVRLEYRSGGASPNLLAILLQGESAPVTVEEEKALDRVAQRLPEALAKLTLTSAERRTVERLLHRPTTRPGARKEVVVTGDFTVRGVLRGPTDEENTGRWSGNHDLLVAPAAAQDLFYQAPAHRQEGVGSVTVEVDSVDNVKEVSQHLRQRGLRPYTLVELIEREQFIYLLVFTAMTVVAGVALLVSALGIINTMLMSVLERVREIGIMKAVGARDGHIQQMFLVEGALLGLCGGLLGLLLGWSASFPGDAWLRTLVKQRLSVELKESIFAFPWWLVVGAPLFASLVTTLAAVYPARRAARVNPISALRHD
jgi:putative ABC transport system permease protein